MEGVHEELYLEMLAQKMTSAFHRSGAHLQSTADNPTEQNSYHQRAAKKLSPVTEILA